MLISAGEISRRVAELAARIDEDYPPEEELVLLGVLKGAFVFLADLARALAREATVDFIALSSYGSSAAGGEVRLVLDTRRALAGRHVLVVEDIVDSGRTLAYLHALLGARAPASLRTVALLRKLVPERAAVPIDYVGFDIPDDWVVGYGLDLAERFRGLPFIGRLDRAQVAAIASG
jgi:hypoxanthine phosphoribosyltransferase